MWLWTLHDAACTGLLPPLCLVGMNDLLMPTWTNHNPSMDWSCHRGGQWLHSGSVDVIVACQHRSHSMLLMWLRDQTPSHVCVWVCLGWAGQLPMHYCVCVHRCAWATAVCVRVLYTSQLANIRCTSLHHRQSVGNVVDMGSCNQRVEHTGRSGWLVGLFCAMCLYVCSHIFSSYLSIYPSGRRRNLAACCIK